MFAFIARNWRKIETAIKVIAFMLTVIIEAIKSVSVYAEREFQAVS